MRRKLTLRGVLLAIVIAAFFSVFELSSEKEKTVNSVAGGEGNIEDVKAGIEWQITRLKDPETGRIPDNIREKELAFVKNIPTDINSRSLNWIARGPHNIGGRTRALAIDVTNENTLLAGSVSGGLWKTTDAGQNWIPVTSPEQFPSISAIEQDTRSGHTDTWYCGTGELLGTSAGATGAYFYGNGMMKSTDGGNSWLPQEATTSSSPQSFDSDWNFVNRIVVDASVDTADIVYAATFGHIRRSADGGASWQIVLGDSPESYYSDMAITSQGVLYACLSSDGITKGIYRSVNGIDWINILPADTFPPVYGKIVLAVNPSNENEIWFLANTTGYGQHSDCFFGYEDWNSLWKYTYLSGDGSGQGGLWENHSMYIPNNGSTTFDNFYVQGGYDMVIKIMPSNPDVIIIGGTNLYRSTDGFSSMNNTTQIGGYWPGSDLPADWGSYENHHPDQHELIFLPSNDNVLLSANDGGVFRTDSVLKETVSWTSLNNAYLTTQLYAVSVDKSSSDDVMVAGFQDNGNYFVNTDDPNATWVMPLNGDGSYSAIADGKDYYYLSIQRGKIYKMQLNAQGEVDGFARIDPIGLKNSLFINPFVLDPNNNDIMYVAGGHKLWRNTNLSSIPLAGNYDSISTGWSSYTDTISINSTLISAVAVSKEPANIIFYGTTSRRIFKVVNANTGDPEHIQMPIIGFPAANVSSIAIDPYDADKVIVVFSNYNSYSLFYTLDGGTSWIKGAGNLEENNNGSGSGPSFRSVSILPIGDDRLYFVGTSTGLYATDKLDSLNTEWIQIGTSEFGNVVVEMVLTRETDGLLVAATHGKGIYSTHITSVNDVIPQSVDESTLNAFKLNAYPNPVNSILNVDFFLPEADDVSVSVYDLSGKLIDIIQKENKSKGNNLISFDVSGLAKGIYLLRLSGHKQSSTTKFIKD